MWRVTCPEFPELADYNSHTMEEAHHILLLHQNGSEKLHIDGCEADHEIKDDGVRCPALECGSYISAEV